MNKAFHYISDTFLSKRLDFRVRLYNVLAMSGIPIGLMMAASCVYTNAGIGNIIINLMIATGLFFCTINPIKAENPAATRPRGKQIACH